MDYEIFNQLTSGKFTEHQVAQFEKLGDLYSLWNARINVISRRDIDNLYIHHVLHSLSIAAFLGPLKDGTRILDLGTGGGFPGIPLAIAYPDCHFHLVDRIAKKLRVAQEVATAIGLKNVTIQHGDIGECHERLDYVVSRAVMRLDALLPLVKRLILPDSRNRYANGLICLKGGDLDEESAGIKLPVVTYPVTEFYSHPFFETKSIVYVPLAQAKKK